MGGHRPPDFDRVARIYRWAEYLSLGTLLQHARTHFLPELDDRRRAFVLGDGDGRFLGRLFAQNPTLEATAVDTSAAMLQLLRANCEAASATASARLRTQHTSALHTAPEPDTDLVVTHFFLDCLTQLQVDALTQSYSDTLASGTLWLISDFGVPRTPLLRPIAAAYIRSLYLAFGILTGLRVSRLPDPQESLAHAGFTLIARKEFLDGLIYTELWSLE